MWVSVLNELLNEKPKQIDVDIQITMVWATLNKLDIQLSGSQFYPII